MIYMIREYQPGQDRSSLRECIVELQESERTIERTFPLARQWPMPILRTSWNAVVSTADRCLLPKWIVASSGSCLSGHGYHRQSPTSRQRSTLMFLIWSYECL